MTSGTIHFQVRRLHRWLGITLGGQLLLWTLGGLYFSWSDMDAVHGDYEKKAPRTWPSNLPIESPSVPLRNLQNRVGPFLIRELRQVMILEEPVYQITYIANAHQEIQLALARTGELRGPLQEAEAVAVAIERFNGKPAVKKVEYLTKTGGHHEYRESPLPAYAVTFDHPSRTTVYVSAELGTVQKFRNSRWRTFDFLWMLHTMDYSGRDNISNWLLRLFSIFGLVTVGSGFALYWVSYRRRTR